jgi:hypothetical protein
MTKKNGNGIEIVRGSNAVDLVPAHIVSSSAGFEDVQAGDLLIPRLVLMQALSPAVVEGSRKAGEVINSLTGEVWIEKERVAVFSPVFHYKEWIIWGDRDEGQGILERSTDPSSELALTAARQTRNEAGDLLVTEYHNFIAVLRERGPSKPVVLGCARTNFKHGRKLLGLAKYRGNYALYAGTYSVGAVLETNKRGQSYYAWGFENVGWVDPGELPVLVTLHEELKSLRWKTDAPTGEVSEKVEI